MRARREYRGGAIPEGHYFVDPKEVPSWGNSDLWDVLKGYVGKGNWPGGTTDWGRARVGIRPDDDTFMGTRTGNYSMHGGAQYGSKGCVDLQRHEMSFFGKFVSNGRILPLEVNYEGVSISK